MSELSNTLYICSEGHNQVIFIGDDVPEVGRTECPACERERTIEYREKQIAALELQVTQLQGTITNLNERLEANGL